MTVVQFMHPGGEVPVHSNPVPWNMGPTHYRRLLRHDGLYVDAENTVRTGDLCFWNEYEAPTNPTAIAQPPTGWDFAHHYHRIIQPRNLARNLAQFPHPNDDGECCTNTDPCVFGTTFKYSNCQQKPDGDLWNLLPGSLILFGALHANLFYLDTVFVTQNQGTQYSVPISQHGSQLQVSQEYMIVTLDNLMPICDFMFYRGKLPQRTAIGTVVKPNEMFSFTPSRIFNSPNYNERYKIDLAALNRVIQPQVPASRQFSVGLKQGHKGIVLKATQHDVETIWREIRNDVIRRSFVLGFNFDW